MSSTQDSTSEIQHLMILKNRVYSLKSMLVAALSQKSELDQELERTKLNWESYRSEIVQKRAEIEERYENELKEYSKQIKLAEEMFEKKNGEHAALMNYLEESKICEKDINDLRNFDWSTLEKLGLGNSNRSEGYEENRKKALLMQDLNQTARIRINDLLDLVTETVNDKKQLHNKLEELRGYSEDWREMLDEQCKKISKMKNDNERLNLLVKQCCITNEPVSEYVTKNVRDKCNSFLSSNSSDELLSGLFKYRQRQDRAIKLLKHKEKKLSRDTSLLQIASDQVADQMQHYLEMVQDNSQLENTFCP